MSLRRKEVHTPFGSRPMNALSMLRDWRRQVQDDLLPGSARPPIQGHGRPQLRHDPRPALPGRQARRGRTRRRQAGQRRAAGRAVLGQRPHRSRRGLAPAGPIVPGRLGRRADRADPRRDPQPQRPAVPEDHPGLSQARLAALLGLLRPRRAARADARVGRRPAPPGGRLPARGGRGHAPGRPRAWPGRRSSTPAASWAGITSCGC